MSVHSEQQEYVPQLEPAWIEDVLEQEGYDHLVDRIPEEERYTVEMKEDVVIRDLEDKSGPLHYPNLEEVARDLDNHIESRHDHFKFDNGDLCIYDRLGPPSIRSDVSVALEDVT